MATLDLLQGDGIELEPDPINFKLRVNARRDVLAFLADLLSTSGPEDGAGAIGIDLTLNYAAATVGALIKSMLGRSAAETAAGVTPVNFNFTFGDLRRYGGVGDDATDCTAALAAAYAQWDYGGAPVFVPRGVWRTTAGHTRSTRLVMRGEGRFVSWIRAVGFAPDTSIISMIGTEGLPINGWLIDGVGFASNNATETTGPRALTQTWCINGRLSDSYFYEVRRGWVGDHSFLNKFDGVSVYQVQQETWILGAECNNNTWVASGTRSVYAHGMLVNGNVAGLNMGGGCNFEGIDTAGKAAVYLAPPTGARVVGVTITGNYFERIAGHAVEAAGADLGSVSGLTVKSNQVYGGYASLLGSAAGKAQYAFVLANVAGYDVSENVLIDWQQAAFFLYGSDEAGRVHNNTTSAAYPVPALHNAGAQFGASVDVQNNFAGRKRLRLADMPTTGSYTAGDYVEKLVPSIDGSQMVLKGWIRLTTGDVHTPGVDWGLDRASHASPAV